MKAITLLLLSILMLSMIQYSMAKQDIAKLIRGDPQGEFESDEEMQFYLSLLDSKELGMSPFYCIIAVIRLVRWVTSFIGAVGTGNVIWIGILLLEIKGRITSFTTNCLS